jgi:hypothetical protein
MEVPVYLIGQAEGIVSCTAAERRLVQPRNPDVDPYFTTKHNGMDIGLSIARKIVDAHGGKIPAENRPNARAIFQINPPKATLQRDPEKLLQAPGLSRTVPSALREP